MGTANKIPGVSGGLVAIAIGFYEELIFSLKRLDKIALKYLFKNVASTYCIPQAFVSSSNIFLASFALPPKCLTQ